MTLSLKNTIPTLALLGAILMMSGCGAANKLASDAKDAADRFGDKFRELVANLPSDDPCRTQNTLFGDLTTCNSPQHKSIREEQCTEVFDAILCGPTVTRVCEENINSPLCDRGIYKEQQTLGRMFVDESDWRASFIDKYRNVIKREESPQPDVTQNLFLANLTSATRYTRTSTITPGFDDDDTTSKKAKDARIFTIQTSDAFGTLTLADSSPDPDFHGFKGVTEGVDIGDNNDGVSFVAGQFNLRSNCTDPEGDCVVHRYYAGIHENTDLGAPLTAVTAATATGTWKGLLRTVGLDKLTSVPFDLDITFRRSANSGTIKANFDSAGRYVIDATFDRFGAVEGDITILESAGTISGIIGQEGLVAAFISIETGVREASDPVGYAGGFVAYVPNSEPATSSTGIPTSSDACVLNNTCVDYAHWAASGADPTDTPTKDRFLKGTEVGLMGVDQGQVTGSASLANLDIPGDAADGYAFYLPVATGIVHNVGIYSTTNLGAPLPNTITKAQWPGLLHERSGTGLFRSHPITLTVGFSTGSGSGSINGKNGAEGLYELVARYSDSGVISGTIIRTAKSGDTITGADTGKITGLIGTDGAVGVFRSNPSSSVSFVGGFLAKPLPDVDYLDWEAVAVANPTDTPTPDRFLKGAPGGLAGVENYLDIAHLDLEDNTNFYPALSGGDAKDGFGLYRPINPHISGSTHNVGIYSTTNLGRPLRGTFANARWAGLLRYRVGRLITDLGVTLNVGFNAGTSAGTITYGNVGTEYQIVADFDGTGVISGDITRRVTGDTSTGTISGLIGAEGAVGVFHSNVGATTPYVGGFVASPPAPNG